MKIASIHELKQELNIINISELKELCLRLAKHKKDNKELLTYLLFEAHNEQGYVEGVKNEMTEAFGDLPKSNLHLTKKSLRKLLRSISKYARHTGSAQSQIEMLIHFCTLLKQSGIPFHKTTALENLYFQQLKKIHTLLMSLHEDLRFDYTKEVNKLEEIESTRSRFVSWFKKS